MIGDFKVKKYVEFINENITGKKQLVVKNNKFELLIGDTLVAETKFNIEDKDEFFNEKYVSIYELVTFEQYRGKGFAIILLQEIFNYVRDSLKLNIITLIVDKDNHGAFNLYLKTGFDIFMEYENSYSLVKKLHTNTHEVISFINKQILIDKKEYSGHIPTKYNRGSKWSDFSWLVDEIHNFLKNDWLTSYILREFSDKYDFETLKDIIKHNFKQEYRYVLQNFDVNG